MLRKTLIAASLLPLSCWGAGFYVGAGLGPDLGDFAQNARITSPGNFDARDKTHHSGRGVFGTLFGGYSLSRDYWSLGAEVNGNLSSLKFKSSNYEYINLSFTNTKFRLRRNYGVSILPGFQYSENTLLYGRLGYANGNFRINTQDVSLKNINRNLDGFRAGLGLKQDLSEHLALRLEYSHIEYEKTTFTGGSNGVVKYTIMRPTTNQFEFGVVYTFAERPALIITKK